jgi:glutathione S-transferase
MRTLYSLPHSPWSERARWTLLHHRLPFVEKAHVPLLGELGLRARARRWRGRVTVPLLIDGRNPVRQSLAIAEYVDAMGSEASLFPGGLRRPIRALDDQIEPTVEALRAFMAAQLDDAAVLELAPAGLRDVPLALPTSRFALGFLARKHAISFADIDARLRAGYAQIRALLNRRRYVHEEGFTYADIICATALQALGPVEDRFVPMGAATRRCWQQRALAEEFADLRAWRDELYDKHRPVGRGGGGGGAPRAPPRAPPPPVGGGHARRPKEWEDTRRA